MNITFDWAVEDADGNETEYEVTCRVQAATPDVWYLANGDPGYPGSPAECEVLKVMLGKVEVVDWEALKFNMGKLEERAYEAANDKAQGDRESYDESREDLRD